MSGKLGPSDPCGTPGAIYGTDIQPDEIWLHIKLPAVMLGDLTLAQHDELVSRLHKALIPHVEWLFRLKWKTHFAGRPDELGDLFPQSYDALFSPLQAGEHHE